ncbi:small nuclear ribonucleoprotein-associated protein B-like [Dermacentor silvarum]|uniref:small nuclear ribonucleoprotein-associated protein B-like n=1 Tax=Dermacentor silvarum TaxID=543639 RepID=UPI00189724AA|nr:small nuclear ribonucleoprotein-associated protein B-like [Dermacentor silvarum]
MVPAGPMQGSYPAGGMMAPAAPMQGFYPAWGMGAPGAPMQGFYPAGGMMAPGAPQQGFYPAWGMMAPGAPMATGGSAVPNAQANMNAAGPPVTKSHPKKATGAVYPRANYPRSTD